MIVYGRNKEEYVKLGMFPKVGAVKWPGTMCSCWVAKAFGANTVFQLWFHF